MSTRKTNKALSKRVKVTKNGKVIRRTAGQAKLRSRRNSAKKMSQNRTQKMSISAKSLSKLMPHS